MGRLSGYKYRTIIKILKRFGFEFHRQAALNFTDKLPAATKFGITQKPLGLQQFPIIQEICQREL